MKKILLISNYVFHYRITIYNHFYDEFKKLGYEFHVLSNQYQKSDVGKKDSLNYSGRELIMTVVWVLPLRGSICGKLNL